MIIYPGGIYIYGDYHMIDVNLVVLGVEHAVSRICQQYLFSYVFSIKYIKRFQ